MRPQTESILDTIVAPATPMGRSALAVVRLSGRDARAIAAQLCPTRTPLEPRVATLARLTDGNGHLVDRAIVTFFPAPASYTGEDVLEISLHGNPVLVGRTLEACVAHGARLARPGEFTERAFLSGKIDLVRAEAVGELIDAQTQAGVRASARRLDGRLSRKLEKARDRLIEAAARLSATIDFAEDVGEHVPAEVDAALSEAAVELAALWATAEAGRLLSAGCRVAILGPPNAGKSTLFNALAGADRAIVTEIPGTTRDTLEVTIDIDGIPVAVVDTAGLRETSDPVERLGVERARREAAGADLVLYVFDAACGWSQEDESFLTGVTGETGALIVANKADQVAATAPLKPAAIATCGLSPGAGEELRTLLSHCIGSGIDTERASEVLGSARQRTLVARSLEATTRARDILSRGEAPEYAVTEVHRAIDALEDLLGQTTTEDVLAQVFASFCIGK